MYNIKRIVCVILLWFVSQASLMYGSGRDALVEAESLFNNGKFNEGILLLSDSADLYPENLEIRLQLGLFLAAVGRFEEAKAFVREGYEADPGKAIKRLAYIAIKTNDHDLERALTPALMDRRSQDADLVLMLFAFGVDQGIVDPIYFSSILQGLDPNKFMENPDIRRNIYENQKLFSLVDNLNEWMRHSPYSRSEEDSSNSLRIDFEVGADSQIHEEIRESRLSKDISPSKLLFELNGVSSSGEVFGNFNGNVIEGRVSYGTEQHTVVFKAGGVGIDPVFEIHITPDGLVVMANEKNVASLLFADVGAGELKSLALGDGLQLGVKNVNRSTRGVLLDLVLIYKSPTSLHQEEFIIKLHLEE